jgi:glycosyltransferase involved in cell wall biosynthesis
VITKPSWGGIVDNRRPRIGYAAFCQGVPDCGKTAVARHLREGLDKVANVVDIRTAFGGRGAPPACDVVLAVECTSWIPEPYFIYLCPEQANSAPADPAVYERAAGLFTDNARLAHWLTESMGIAREKIHVISPAVPAGRRSPRARSPYLREAPRRRLLLPLSDSGGQPVGDESVRLVLDALDILRQSYDPQICLTISGLEEREFSGSPGDGVTFLSAPLAQDVIGLFDRHDLLVLPPEGDCHGLPEAFAQGIPCVATRASDMSDAITPGVTGTVIDGVNARELAAAIASVLGDDNVYRSCLERAPAMAAYFSWERVAREVTYVISREVGLIP